MPWAYASYAEQFLTAKLCCLGDQKVFMLRSIIYFHMLSHTVILGDRCSTDPKTQGDVEIARSPMSACSICKGG